MNTSHRHASTAALAGQKRKLVPRPNSMLMISPASDTNLITAAYQQHIQAATTAAATTTTASDIRASITTQPQASAGTTGPSSAPAYTPIQPAPTANQLWPAVGAASTSVPQMAVNHHQHASIMTTSMVQMLAAQSQKGRPASFAMPATLALAHAHAAAAAAAAAGSPSGNDAATAAAAAGRTTKKTAQAVAAVPTKKPAASPPAVVAPPPTPQPSPADFVKNCFRQWGVTTEPTREASYFIKVTPDRISAYNRDLLATVRQRDIVKLQRLHEEGKVKNACNPFGESVLHLACRKGLTEVVEFLCAKPEGPRLSLFVHDDYGRTVMHDACWTVRPQWPLVEFLLEHCPQLLACSDVRGHIPLDYVPKSDWQLWIDFLVERQDKMKEWMMVATAKKQQKSSVPADKGQQQSRSPADAPEKASCSSIPVPQAVLDRQQQLQQDQLKATLQAAVSVSSSPSLVPSAADTSQSASSSTNSLDVVIEEEDQKDLSSEDLAPRIMG